MQDLPGRKEKLTTGDFDNFHSNDQLSNTNLPNKKVADIVLLESFSQ